VDYIPESSKLLLVLQGGLRAAGDHRGWHTCSTAADFSDDTTTMVVPLNKKLYARVLAMYPGPSTAYRSGHIVQTYKRLGGRYSGAKKPRLTGLHRWFLEKWKSDTGKTRYTSRSSVYRPTRRVTSKTPVTFGELSESALKRAKRLKRETGRAKFFI